MITASAQMTRAGPAVMLHHPDDSAHVVEVIGLRRDQAPGWSRVAAFGIDYAFVLVYLGFLTLVGVLARTVGVLPTEITTPTGRVVGQLVAFAVLTLPVTGWFAAWEATPSGATPGKRLLGLQVLTTDHDRLSLRRSLSRTALKFTIPWELAHTAVWNMLVWPGDPSIAADTLLLGVANAAIAVDLLSLFVGSRRTPYDRVVGTFVSLIRSQGRPEHERSSDGNHPC
jgi:uncharacterized RDD family membrane protein YckC